MTELTYARVQAALGSVLANWLPEDASPDGHVRRRSFICANWPGLGNALDELVLAVTADTAATIEEMTAAHAPMVDGLPTICPGSGQPVLGDVVPIVGQSRRGRAMCPACGLVVDCRDLDAAGWLLGSHSMPEPD